jgi:YHS domain-containing protein
MLDDTGVANWIMVPAVQARRMGYLQNVPRHRHGSMAIFGFADREVVVHALQTLGAAERERGVCPDCVAFVWKVVQTLMANVALDPVCEEVVDSDSALTTCHAGTHYYFCSTDCLHAFKNRPEMYVERTLMEQRVGRRTVLTAPRPPEDAACKTRLRKSSPKKLLHPDMRTDGVVAKRGRSS